jgi:hypothetical protein
MGVKKCARTVIPWPTPTWHRILDAIERLQAQKPAEGEPIH